MCNTGKLTVIKICPYVGIIQIRFTVEMQSISSQPFGSRFVRKYLSDTQYSTVVEICKVFL